MPPESDHGDLALERFRTYLLMLARGQLRGQVAQKLDASDVVQQTLLDAHRQRASFRGATPAEMAGWLRRMLACNLADAVRALTRGKRDVGRERALEAALAESSARLEAWLLVDQSSPSQRAIHNERVLRLADAVAALPEGQREAVLLHYWQDLPLADVAQRMGRTPPSVAGLLQRGLKALRERLAESE